MSTLDTKKLMDGDDTLKLEKKSITIIIPFAPKVEYTILAKYPKLDIEIRKLKSGRVQIIKDCGEENIPSSASLNLKSLNNKYTKLVHSAVVKKLKPYFCEGTGMYKFDAGFDNLPPNLLDELLIHLAESSRRVN